MTNAEALIQAGQPDDLVGILRLNAMDSSLIPRSSSFCAVDGLIESVGKEELAAESDDQEHFRTIVLFDNVRRLVFSSVFPVSSRHVSPLRKKSALSPTKAPRAISYRLSWSK